MSPVEKSSLRKTALGTRLAIAPALHIVWSHACAERLWQLIETIAPNAKVIAGYTAVRGEVVIMPALAAFATHHTLALPLITPDSKVLSFKHYALGDPLTQGAYGIHTPLPTAKEVVPDIIIAPMLAFDKMGHRLGYGGGYYDATLGSFGHHPVIAIGVAFALQQVDVIPAESFDMRMHAIVTEKEVIKTA